MLEENQHQTEKFCQVQMHIILLSIVVITTGLVAFVGLQSRGPNTPSKLFFLANTENAQSFMPPSLANTSPISLAYHQPNQQMRQKRAYTIWSN